MYIPYALIMQRKRILDQIIEKKLKIGKAGELLGVTRQTAGKWLAQYKLRGIKALEGRRPGPKKGTIPHNKTPDVIEQIVVELAHAFPFEGPVELSYKLEEDYQIKLDQSTVYRIMKRENVRYANENDRLSFPNKPIKHYCLHAPGIEIQLDTCFPFGRQRKAVVYDAIDDCSRFVFAKIYTNQEEQTSIAFVRELINHCPFRIQAIRTDCGKEFSRAFTGFLEENGIEHKKNPPYTPQHNGKIERYHRTFKEREVCHWPFDASIEQLNYRLALWLYYYNHKKRHGGLEMNRMTPAQKIYYTTLVSSLQDQNKNVICLLQQNII